MGAKPSNQASTDKTSTDHRPIIGVGIERHGPVSKIDNGLPGAMARAADRSGWAANKSDVRDIVRYAAKQNDSPTRVGEGWWVCYRYIDSDIDWDAPGDDLLADVLEAIDNTTLDTRPVVVVRDLADVADSALNAADWFREVLDAGAAVVVRGLGDEPIVEPGTDAADVLVNTLLVAGMRGFDKLPGDSGSSGIPWIDGEIKHHGRPPVGFRVRDGVLEPAGDFETVRKHLLAVDWGEMSQRECARRLDCDPRTVRRILDDDERRELYRLG